MTSHGLAAFGGPLRDLSPEKVNSLICGWNVDWVFIYVGGFVQRASFHFSGVRVSCVDWLFACLLFCFVLFCFVVVLLVVQCAKHSFCIGRSWVLSHSWLVFFYLNAFFMAEVCKLSGHIIVCFCFLLLPKCCNAVCVVLLSCLDAAFYSCARWCAPPSSFSGITGWVVGDACSWTCIDIGWWQIVGLRSPWIGSWLVPLFCFLVRNHGLS